MFLDVRHICVKVLSLLVTSCVNLELNYLICKVEMIIAPMSKACGEN